MTVAIDIDGVITDVHEYEKEKGKIFLGKDVVDESGEDIDTIFDVSKEDKHRFWAENYKDYIVSSVARKGASEATHELSRLGYRVIIVTARKYNEVYSFASEEEFREATRTNLIKNEIYFDEIYFEPRPKVPAVTKYGIDFFIEDDPVNIVALAEHTNVVILDNPYNRDVDVANACRAYTWEEVVNVIKNS